MPNTSYYIQSSSHIVTPLETKKNGVIIKILYDVTKGKVFLISLLITWANINVLIREEVLIQEHGFNDGRSASNRVPIAISIVQW